MKTLFTASKYCFILGLFLWVIETALFNILYGWHYSPINETELYFDRSVGFLFTAGFITGIIGFIKFIDTIITKLPND